MAKHSRLIFLSSMLLLMLLFSLARPTATALADDGAPPPPATEEPIQPPTEEATEEPTAIPDEVAPLTEKVVEEPALPQDTTVAEVLAAAPEGTEVVVLDEGGEALSLASAQAVEIVAVVDPIWCPAGQAPTPGTNGCTTSFATPEDLINAMAADPTAYDEPGVIYFTTNPGGAFILAPGSGSLDTADFDTLTGYNLTLQGGWSGASGDTNFSQTNFGANPVQIGDGSNPWLGNLTINNITIDGASTTGLMVISAGDITLNNVSSSNNDGDGAYLDNTYGSGSIVVNANTSSITSMSGNNGDGLDAIANGDIVLNNVTANGNAWDGIYLDNSNSGNNNYINAESAVSTSGNGDIALTSVIANDNGEYGADIYSSGNVSINSSVFGDGINGNGMVGLGIGAEGNVTLASVTASGNAWGGAYLYSYGDILVSNSSFDGNFNEEGGGLYIGTGGNIVLDNVSASNNTNIGLGIFNLSGVTIKNSTFNGNGYDGADLMVFGGDATILCSQFQNNGDGDTGVGVDGSGVFGTFTLDDVTFAGNAEGDYVGSPVITSGGCVVVKGNGDKPQSPSDLPLQIVPVRGDELVGLNCNDFSGTELVLPNGDKVILHCPLLGEAMLMGQTQDQLLGALTSQYTFLSALTVQVSHDGETVKTVSPALTVDFVIPEGQQGGNFAILHWSGGQWIELPDCTITPNGFFQARTNYTGLFVLVKK